MTSLASRIADVKKKAEAWRSIKATDPDYWTVWKKYQDIDPDLFLAMADEIDRLRDERDQARAALEPFAPPNTYDFYSDHDFADDAGIMMFWNTAKEAKDFCDWMTNYIEQYRTATRVHAETGEKK